ncbi:MFS transporter [Kribbella sp. NBC_01505]|uniref:MFS transporter n=1 Tax=Kribbella sp. NBC_01505 TaxID=2903580 RepID=UPI00386D0272
MTEVGGFRAAVGVPEFRGVWAGEALSQIGDQLARVALSVLVFDRTGSAALAALTLGLSYTPAFIGSALLSGLADRLPRRDVMVGCDLICVVLVVLMAIRGMPLAVVCVAMAGVALVGGPFRAARLALLPEMLTGESYVSALALRSMTIQTAQLIGFAAGGVVVAFVGPRTALVIDAATFLCSALILRFTVRRRPAPAAANRRSFWMSTVHGARVIRSIPGLPALYVLGMLAGLYIGPEGLAAAWVAELAAPPATVGLLMGAPAAGLVVGAWLFTRYVVPERRPQWTGPLAIAAGAVLGVCFLRPGVVVVLVVLVLSGVFTAYQIQVGATFGRETPAESRAQVMGLLNSGVLTAQGVGVLLAGLLADRIGVAHTVAVAGVAGAVIAAATSLRAAAASPVSTRHRDA